MRRTNEEFRAEVFRRKEEIMKKRRKNIKNMLYAAVCMPVFCAVLFVGISLAIAMQPAGGEAPPSNTGTDASVIADIQHAQTLEISTLSEQESEALLSFLSEITRASAQIQYDRGEQEEIKYEYSVIIRSNGSVRKVFYVSREYVSLDGEYFAVTGEQYEQFLVFISEGETQ